MDVFISYRREDSLMEANLISQSLGELIGSDSVFFDNLTINPSENWPERIQQSIEAAKIIVIVIGPQWIKVADEWGRRKLDSQDDWVRKELESAISYGLKIIPVLVNTAKMPPKDALPMSIQEISNKQAIEIRRNFWNHDIKLLLAQFSELIGSSMHNSHNSPYPRSLYIPPSPIQDDKLALILANELQSWTHKTTELPNSPGTLRAEITRSFKFESFQSAINFMAEVASGCDIANHHPRWENIWKTVTVFLSTWDGQLHKVSDRDIMIAKYFERAYVEYNHAK